MESTPTTCCTERPRSRIFLPATHAHAHHATTTCTSTFCTNIATTLHTCASHAFHALEPHGILALVAIARPRGNHSPLWPSLSPCGHCHSCPRASAQSPVYSANIAMYSPMYSPLCTRRVTRHVYYTLSSLPVFRPHASTPLSFRFREVANINASSY